MRCALLLTAIGCLAGAAPSQAAIILWDDPDPLTPPSAPANLIVNTVDASGITGDATRTAVGEVVQTGAAKFVGFNPGALPINPGLHGQEYTLSLDYFIPQDTTLDALPDGSSPDLFWIQLDANGTNIGASAGFINGGAAGGGWQTLTLAGNVPANVGPNPTVSLTPLFVMADGGFGAGVPNGDGTGVALYVDNVRLEVVPEPAAVALLAIGLLGVSARRS